MRLACGSADFVAMMRLGVSRCLARHRFHRFSTLCILYKEYIMHHAMEPAFVMMPLTT